ncbi:MAG: hypothetical protein KC457_21595, partial [Myxococcales bacterium]|nr:hypothetical protein [Myxococcales bacterium]
LLDLDEEALIFAARLLEDTTGVTLEAMEEMADDVGEEDRDLAALAAEGHVLLAPDHALDDLLGDVAAEVVADRQLVGEPGLAGLELGGAAVAMGAGMLGYGKAFRPYEDRPPSLSKKAQTPLIAGTTLLSIGYLNASMIGMYTWQANRDDPQARRTRDRLLIPVVGPWIHAAGPDADWLMAILTGGLGALQIAGAIALGVGAGLSARERRGYRRRSEVALVPSFQGVAVVGRF